MKLAVNTIKSSRGARHIKKRVGRGNASGHGTYSTRGMKGQRARSGGKAGLRAHAFKELMQSTPKSRGFKSFKIKPVTVTLSALNKFFNDGDTVSIETLREKNIISKNTKSAKVVTTGELQKKLTVNIPATKSAAELITRLGGQMAGGKDLLEEKTAKENVDKK